MLTKKLLFAFLFIFSASLIGCGTPASETGAAMGEAEEEEFFTEEEEAGEEEQQSGGRKKKNDLDNF